MSRGGYQSKNGPITPRFLMTIQHRQSGLSGASLRVCIAWIHPPIFIRRGIVAPAMHPANRAALVTHLRERYYRHDSKDL